VHRVGRGVGPRGGDHLQLRRPPVRRRSPGRFDDQPWASVVIDVGGDDRSPSIAADPRHATRWRRRRRFPRACVCSTARGARNGCRSVRAAIAATDTADQPAQPLPVATTCATPGVATEASRWGGATELIGNDATANARHETLRIRVPSRSRLRDKSLRHSTTKRSLLNEIRSAVSCDSADRSTCAASAVGSAPSFCVSTSVFSEGVGRRRDR